MFFLHSPDCKGPPIGCDRGYWLILGIYTATSILEWVLARYWANSQGAQFDALHSLLHSGIVWSFIHVGKKTKKLNLAADQERKLRLKYCRRNIYTVLGLLVSMTVFEAIPKFWHPVAVVGGFMVFSIVTGASAIAASIFILGRVGKLHSPVILIGKECRGHQESHETVMFDNKSDLKISGIAFFTAILIWKAEHISPHVPYFNLVLPFFDPALSVFIAVNIGVAAFQLLRSLENSEIVHYH